MSVLTSDPQDSLSEGAPENGDAEESFSHARLSKRQMQVLGLLREGKTNEEIAKTLCRSPNTIKVHVSAILRQQR